MPLVRRSCWEPRDIAACKCPLQWALFVWFGSAVEASTLMLEMQEGVEVHCFRWEITGIFVAVDRVVLVAELLF